MTLARSDRTLIVQPLPGIGDMVWHLPHIHAIAKTTLAGTVDILTKRRSQADRLLCADPSVKDVLWLERDGHHAGTRGLFRLMDRLRQNRYQRAWILHGSARYALAAWLAGIPERLGYGIGWQAWLLNTAVCLAPEHHHTHPIVRANALLDLLGVQQNESEPRLLVATEADQAITGRFGTLPLPWVALGIGSSEPWKQWGATRFATLTRLLTHRQQASVLIVGGSAERSLADAIFQQLGDSTTAVDAVSLPLEQTIALLARCCSYIGNDTGVLNIAAAVGTHAIGLFGASPPLGHSRFIHPVLPPAGQTGMAAITPDQALGAFRQLDCLQ
ncbi:MAG: glycosyl transferase family 1 [Candidatus Contendobacter odensis]|uniref:Glycosyl transferase family 1 n=1 Tax=Candidatus Contendibacter odensensis TaxID=1400860 RepID=A0A2G6PES1_9GAMM|nr:MAG: glycosyl transferase family 1 [Candidatus Contendobacter odensis]